MKKTLLFIALLCAVAQGAWAQNYAYWDGLTREQPPLSGNNTILIQNAAQLAYARDHWQDEINNSYHYYDIDYYLQADLDLSAESWHSMGRGLTYFEYNGTFWGNGHSIKIRMEGGDQSYRGLFAAIGEYGMVKNLHIEGIINVGNARLVGGIAGLNRGIIENCWVSADITSSHYHFSDNADLGGIVGENTNVLRYCGMTGNVTNTGNNSGVGGIVGSNFGGPYNNKGVRHCTFYGSVSVNHDQHNKYVGEERGGEENLYDEFNQSEYDNAIGMNMYRHAIKYPYAINVTTVGQGSLTVSCGGENNVPGARAGQEVTLTTPSGTVARVTITDDDGYNIPVGGNQDSGYSFNMPNNNVTATVVFYENWPTQGNGTEGVPYLISTEDDWNKFAHNVNYGRNYSGKVIRLANDISVTKSAGSCNAANDTDYKPFSGTFEGYGNTLTINLSNQSRFGAPFKCVEGATINNLHTAGTIDGTGNENGKLLSGLVGISFGNTTIISCVSSVTLNTDFGAQGYIDAALAGFVAGTVGGSLTVSGCVFNGSMTGTDNQRCAGISGYEYSDVGQGFTTTTIRNCLFAPATLTVSIADDGFTKTITRDPDATITNCYYTQTLGTAQGTEASTPTSNPGNIGNLVAYYSKVTAYENAIFFDGKYYVAPSATTIIQPEDEWDAVCWQTHTAPADWTAINSGSTTGYTLGSAGNTTYYYITDNLNFSNSTAGGSGLNIQGTVYLYIPYGLTLTCTGANAHETTGAGAGIGLTSGNNLYLIGSGTLNATGGNAANGGNGGTGSDATGSSGDWTRTGTGGNGGYGGGGAGAGIGTRGGNGGSGGSGGAGYRYDNGAQDDEQNGTDGTSGSAGATAGAMGTIYVYKVYQQSAAVTVNATGGAAGTSGGSGGQRGRGYAYDGLSYNVTVAGGGGGGGGGFGGAASNIGTGGPGGGGGAGGAGGAQDWKSNSTGGVYDVTAYGGKGGKNANGTSAADGTEAGTNGTAQSQGWVYVENGSFSSSDWHPASGACTFGNGGNGGGCGNASRAGMVQRVWGSLVLGSGTDTNPYQIKCAADFDQLAANVNGGTTYENKYFVLVNDISVKSMVGTSDANSFQGAFDGGGKTLTVSYNTSENWTAPFRHVKDATIKNLHVDGTIYTSGQFAGGIVGESHKDLNITNCRSSVAINSSVSGDGTHGGLVSTLSGSGNTITIDGCVFDGSFAKTANTTNCGGFVGWPVYNRPVITNSLMKPSSVAAGMLNNTFARWHTTYEPTITNCFFFATSNLPTNQGKQAVTDAEILPVGEPVAYNVSGITAYTNGIRYGGNFYYNPDRNIKRTITGYGDEDGKWAFIASPVNSDIAPAAVTNLIGMYDSGTGLYDYDLFRLNPGESQWENYVQHNEGFSIVNGNGYLYATQTTKNLVFSGTFNTESSKTVELSEGFNLVGNPFGVNAYANRSYYKMNTAGTDIEAVENYAENPIPVCTGVVVRTENANESVTFSTSAPQQQSSGNNGNLQMTLTKAGVRSDAFQDKAIVSFNQGSQLEKFVFNERHAKLYIPQYGEDYAIAFSDMSGEVPLNFKATETGRYTIGFNFENVKGVRIQLIDKIEDKIIDLKAIDSYTFMGSAVDHSDRFTLVFTQVETDGVFAYQSGNDIIVSGEGTLEVFDVMGRMVMNQHINGVQTVEKPSTTGVYIFRLNGMSQKIVVK